jgi:hypothetical protein
MSEFDPRQHVPAATSDPKAIGPKRARRVSGSSPVSHQSSACWSDRWIDFVCGFLLGIVACIGRVARGAGVESVGMMLLAGLFLGTLTALFGRRVWRWLF